MRGRERKKEKKNKKKRKRKKSKKNFLTGLRDEEKRKEHVKE